MSQIGKITSLDTNNGTGTIILESGDTKDFSMKDWIDFNKMPEYGLKVQINDEYKLFAVQEEVKIQENDSSNYKERAEQFIIKYIKDGWKLEYNNGTSFSMSRKQNINILKLLFHTFWISIILIMIFGPSGIIVALVIVVMITMNNSSDVLVSSYDKDRNKILITINNETPFVIQDKFELDKKKADKYHKNGGFNELFHKELLDKGYQIESNIELSKQIGPLVVDRYTTIMDYDNYLFLVVDKAGNKVDSFKYEF
ncbi:hypothetical protein KKG72_01640 [bacterium]|nr:hypothetical protein [bacterium]MBU1993183.1 hypothetical protein [bacterium]